MPLIVMTFDAVVRFLAIFDDELLAYNHMIILNIYNPDIDECVNNGSGCDHNCANLLGSYECSCRQGYSLAADGFSCNGISHDYSKLYYTLVDMT